MIALLLSFLTCIRTYENVCSYEAGDHVAVFPTNDADLIAELGRLVGDVDLDVVFKLVNTDGTVPSRFSYSFSLSCARLFLSCLEDSSKKHPFPCPTTYRRVALGGLCRLLFSLCTFQM